MGKLLSDANDIAERVRHLASKAEAYEALAAEMFATMRIPSNRAAMADPTHRAQMFDMWDRWEKRYDNLKKV